MISGISLRRQALMARKKGSSARLPAEYQEVEWIGYSTSKLFLITSVEASNVTKVVSDVEKLSVPSSGTVFPDGGGSTSWGTVENLSGSKWSCNPSYARDVLFGRTTLTSTKTGSPSGGVRIGYSTATFCPSLRYYTLKIYGANDALLFDGVPCYRKSDNRIGMYDMVSDSFVATTKSGAASGNWSNGDDVP